eukprot:scaffold257978_cov30-Tisochrysis_lutea.AAC.4
MRVRGNGRGSPGGDTSVTEERARELAVKGCGSAVREGFGGATWSSRTQARARASCVGPAAGRGWRTFRRNSDSQR